MADILPPPPVDAPFTAYNWVDWYKKVRDAINAAGDVNHNTLLGLQGGTAGEYYHFTQAQYNDLISLLSAPPTDPWTYVKLASDFDTSSSTPVDVTGLGFTPEANKTYVVEAFLLTRSSDVAVGVKPGVSWSSGLTDGAAFIQQTNGASSVVVANVNYAADGEASGTDMPATGASYPALISATFITGGSPSGTFNITLAKE